MTDAQKIKIIDALVEKWHELGCEHPVGILYAIDAVLSMGDEMPKKEYTGIFDEIFKCFMPPKGNGDNGNV